MELEERRMKSDKKVLHLMQKLKSYNNKSDQYSETENLVKLFKLMKIDDRKISFSRVMMILYKYLKYVRESGLFDSSDVIESIFKKILNPFDDLDGPEKTLIPKLCKSYGMIIPYIEEYNDEYKKMYQSLIDLINITHVSDIDDIIKKYVAMPEPPDPYIIYYRTIRKRTDNLLNIEDYKEINYWRRFLNRNDEYGFEKRFDKIGRHQSDFDDMMLFYIKTFIPNDIDNENIAFLIEKYCKKPTRQLDWLPYRILQSIKRTLLNIDDEDVRKSKKSTYKAFKKLVEDIEI